MWWTLIIHILKFVILSTGKQEWICYDAHIMRMATQNFTAQPTTLRPVSLLFYRCAEGQIGAIGAMMCRLL